MKTLRDLDLNGQKVILRAGFDLPLDDGEIADDARVKAGLKTIQYIRKQNPDFFLIANHMGRPAGERVPELSNRIVAERLQKLLGVAVEVIDDVEELQKFVEDGLYEQDKIYMLENLRFWKEEKAADSTFGRNIGEIFDIYVNDAFSVSHRAHASFVRFPEFTKDKCMGLLFEEEYFNLSKVKNDPEHPAVMVIGGAKIATKLPVIENMMRIYDKVLVGGMIANEALDERIDLGEKVLLPTDFNPKEKEDERLDIGDGTIDAYEEVIKNAKTIVWNGPLGKFEDEDAAEGTRRVCRAIAANEEALQVIGGGETLDAVNHFSDFSHFDYVSMSGGAMLEYLSGKTLPGIEALENREE